MLRTLSGLGASIVTTLLLAATPAAAAEAGDPDPTFGGDGFALIDQKQDQWEIGVAVDTAPDGRIVVGGYTAQGAIEVSYLARLMPDGSLDPSFGAGGIRTILGPCGGYAAIEDLEVLADGRVLTGGSCLDDFLLMRFNTDGSDDLGFDGDPKNPGGGDGVVRTGFGAEDVGGMALAVDSADGAITLGGYCCTGDGTEFQNTTLARYTADGKLDPGFDGPAINPGGGNGRVILMINPGGDDRSEDIVPIGGGSIALTTEGAENTVVVAVDAVGKALKSFSGDGLAVVDFGTNTAGRALAVDGAGRLLVASEVHPAPGETGSFGAARLDLNGNLDAVFGTPIVDPTPGHEDYLASMEVQADGSPLIVGIGSAQEGMFSTFHNVDAVRLTPSGQPDSSYGPGGVRLHAGPAGHAYAIDSALDQEGRLLVTGRSGTSSGTTPGDILVARFKATADVAGPPSPPSNGFRFAGLKRNKKKGTATLFVEVPGPGSLIVTSSPKVRGAAKRPTAAGKVGLPIKLRGKAKQLLSSRALANGVGRVKVTAQVTFGPTGGAALTVPKKLSLVKRD